MLDTPPQRLHDVLESPVQPPVWALHAFQLLAILIGLSGEFIAPSDAFQLMQTLGVAKGASLLPSCVAYMWEKGAMAPDGNSGGDNPLAAHRDTRHWRAGALFPKKYSTLKHVVASAVVRMPSETDDQHYLESVVPTLYMCDCTIAVRVHSWVRAVMDLYVASCTASGPQL